MINGYPPQFVRVKKIQHRRIDFLIGLRSGVVDCVGKSSYLHIRKYYGKICNFAPVLIGRQVKYYSPVRHCRYAVMLNYKKLV